MKIFNLIFFYVVFSVLNSFSQQRDASEIYDYCIDKVGLITDDENGFGSGFFVNPNTFITNNHVVQGLNRNNIYILLKSGEEISATVKATDKDKDLAILITKNNNNDYLYLMPPEDIKQGDKVYALGNSSTEDYKLFKFGITDGIINNIKYDFFKGNGLDIKAEVILHTATINKGNSGGPLVSSNGAVVGINSFYYTLGNNLYFAIHTSELIDFLKENNIKYKIKKKDESLTSNKTLFIIVGIAILIVVISIILIIILKSSKKRAYNYQSAPVQRQIVNLEPSVQERTIQHSPGQSFPNFAGEAYLIYRGKKFRIDRAFFVVGRDTSSNLVLEDAMVSREHFAIIKKDANFILKDLNSKNGTFLNGVKINSELLKNSDVIKAGSTSIIFNQ